MTVESSLFVQGRTTDNSRVGKDNYFLLISRAVDSVFNVLFFLNTSRRRHRIRSSWTPRHPLAPGVALAQLVGLGRLALPEGCVVVGGTGIEPVTSAS